jgi:List-Bact-rpt repeat protein
MSRDLRHRVINPFTIIAMLTLHAGGAVAVCGSSLAARALTPIRKRLHTQTLLGTVAVLLTLASLAAPPSAQAQGTQDLCLEGTWTTPSLSSVPELFTGTETITFPSPERGSASLSVDANKTYLSSGEPLVIPAGGGVAGEFYSVSSASIPVPPYSGTLSWTPVPTDGLFNNVNLVEVEPVLPPAYTCTATGLVLAIQLDVITGYGTADLLVESFERLSPAPAGLNVTTSGEGSGTVTSGSSIDCSHGEPSCSAWVPAGSVTLDAVASPGSAFAGWTGLCSGSNQVCGVVLGPGEIKFATARFEPLRQLSVAKAGKGDGEVSSEPAGITCPPGSSACPPASFTQGTRVKLTATPVNGSVFQGWSGGCVGQTCEVSMDSDTSVTATFEPKNLVHSLSVSKDGKGGGTVSSEPAGVECGSLCSAWFLRGTPVILRANAAAGSSFGGWSGSCSGTGACSIVMNDDESVMASFTATPAETALAQSLSEVVARLEQLAQNSGLGFLFHASEPGVLSIGLYDASPGGKLARMSRAKPILVGVGRHAFSRAATARIKIKLTPHGKALLKHAKRLTLTAKGAFKTHGKVAIEKTETFVLRHH